MRTQRAWSTSALSTWIQQSICEHEGSAGVWIWANLVSPRCGMVHLPWKHVERLAILSAENRFRLAPCSLRPTGCARGECRLPAPRGRRRCQCGRVAASPLPKCRGSEQATMPTACCGRCMSQDGLCRIFGGIWAPPLGTPSEARYICSSLIGKPRRFEWRPETAGLRSGHCAMSHTRRSFHRASWSLRTLSTNTQGSQGETEGEGATHERFGH